MNAGRTQLLQEIPDEYRAQLVKQQLEYQYIRTRASRTMQTVLAVISIAVSIGFIQFIYSGAAIQDVSLQLSEEAANRCSPESVEHSNLTLQGMGLEMSIIAVGILMLAFYLLWEMWMVNKIIQDLPTSLYPRHEADLWIGEYADWIRDNRNQIGYCHDLFTVLRRKLYYSIGLVAVCLLLIGLIQLDMAVSVFRFGLGLITLGLFFVFGYVGRYYFSAGKNIHSSFLSHQLFNTAIIVLGTIAMIGTVYFVVQIPLLLLPFIGLAAVLITIGYSVMYPSLVNRNTDGLFDFSHAENRFFHLRTRFISPVFVSLSIIPLGHLIAHYFEIYLLFDHLLIC